MEKNQDCRPSPELLTGNYRINGRVFVIGIFQKCDPSTNSLLEERNDLSNLSDPFIGIESGYSILTRSSFTEDQVDAFFHEMLKKGFIKKLTPEEQIIEEEFQLTFKQNAEGIVSILFKGTSKAVNPLERLLIKS